MCTQGVCVLGGGCIRSASLCVCVSRDECYKYLAEQRRLRTIQPEEAKVCVGHAARLCACTYVTSALLAPLSPLATSLVVQVRAQLQPRPSEPPTHAARDAGRASGDLRMAHRAGVGLEDCWSAQSAQFMTVGAHSDQASHPCSLGRPSVFFTSPVFLASPGPVLFTGLCSCSSLWGYSEQLAHAPI